MLDDQNELLIVVDEKDNIIGFRTRYDCHHNKTLLHRVVGILIYNDKGELLLQKRSKYKDLNPGKFTMSASGHVLKGLSSENAALKELKEELGINVLLTFVKKFVIRNNQESTMAILFQGYHNGPFKIASDEIDMVEFVPKEKIQSMKELFTPNSQETFRQIGLLK